MEGEKKEKMFETFGDKLWKFLCCSTTIHEQNEQEIKKKAKEAETEDFYVGYFLKFGGKYRILYDQKNF